MLLLLFKTLAICREANVRDIGSVSQRQFGKYSIDVLDEQDLTNALAVVLTMYAFVGDEDEESANEVFFQQLCYWQMHWMIFNEISITYLNLSSGNIYDSTYILLYILHHFPNPIVHQVCHAFRFFSCTADANNLLQPLCFLYCQICFFGCMPACILKQLVNVVQLTSAAEALAVVDAADANADSKASS